MLSAEYIAGFFDGEGCIGISMRGKNHQVFLRASIVNTDCTVLASLYAQFGGVLATRARPSHPHWKTAYSWVLDGPRAAEFLKLLQPYLVIKQRQCVLALEFALFMDLPRKQRCVPISTGSNLYVRRPEILTRELEFKAKMHELNRKGVAYAQ